MEQTNKNKKTGSIIAFLIFTVVSVIHIILTNIEGNYFDYSKVLLMPSLAVFFLLTVKNRKKGLPIVWAEAGLWIGNVCLIWGEESKILFIAGSAFTIIGFLGYIYVMGIRVEKLSRWFILIQLPLIWICTFFLILMKDDLGSMLIPIAIYMTLIAVISITALGQLMSHIRSRGSLVMFLGSLFYIAENGLYTANHYMNSVTFGENIVHPCFIIAQTLFAAGYLLIEKEELKNNEA